MRFPLTLATLLLLSTIAHAEPAAEPSAKGPRWGAKLGFNLASIDYDSSSVESKRGLAAGLVLAFPVRPDVWLQSELSYNEKGILYDYMDISARLELDYLEAAFLVSAMIPNPKGPTIYFVAGPTLGVLVGAEVTETDEIDESSESADVTEEFAGWELGMAAGVGLLFGSLSVEVRYQYGLSNIDNPDEGYGDDAIHNRVMTVALGYLF